MVTKKKAIMKGLENNVADKANGGVFSEDSGKNAIPLKHQWCSV